MHSLLALFVVIAGASLTVQVGLNAVLGGRMGSTVAAVFVNFMVGTAAMALLWAASHDNPIGGKGLVAGPWWAYFGGVLGAFYVVMATLGGPKLGASALLALTLLGQLAAALLVDHYGWLGFSRQPFDHQKALGIVLLCAAVALLVKK
jgi:bacterial/archaeal transporter family-2 protein